jgi:predicted  nucleic acid-binding Zn-ribbon protein
MRQDGSARELIDLRHENSQLKKVIDAMERENIKVTERLHERNRYENDSHLKVDDLNKQLDAAIHDHKHKDEEIITLKVKLDEARKECDHLRGEVDRYILNFCSNLIYK